MTTQPTPDLRQLLDDDLVAEYLEDHPEFFNRHPQLLHKLSVATQERGAVSLVEHQLELMRRKIRGLEEEITSLLAVASHNEQLYGQYAELFFALYACEDLDSLTTILNERVTNGMGLSRVTLKLYAGEAPAAVHMPGYELEALLTKRLAGNGHYFGRLNNEEQQQLFDAEFDGSVALITLGDNQDQGLLAVASDNPGHFHPAMDPLLLTQLSRLLSLMIDKLLDKPA